MHMNGSIANALVGTGDMCGQNHNIPRFRAIKPYSDKELMLGAQCNDGYKPNGLKKVSSFSVPSKTKPSKFRVMMDSHPQRTCTKMGCQQLGPNMLWDWKHEGSMSRYRYFAGAPDMWRSSHDFELLDDSQLLTPTRDHRYCLGLCRVAELVTLLASFLTHSNKHPCVCCHPAETLK